MTNLDAVRQAMAEHKLRLAVALAGQPEATEPEAEAEATEPVEPEPEAPRPASEAAVWTRILGGGRDDSR